MYGNAHSEHNHEDEVIIISDSVKDPNAIVIEFNIALIGNSIMFASDRLPDEAARAHWRWFDASVDFA